jgi:hypothetical protein
MKLSGHGKMAETECPQMALSGHETVLENVRF